MITGIHGQAASNATEENVDAQISERRIWTAVLLQALEDWRYGNLRRQKEAEKFIFHCENDFATVCRSAGLEPSSVLAKLQRMRPVAHNSWSIDGLSRNLNLPTTAAA
jgi:hypothetical protein